MFKTFRDVDFCLKLHNSACIIVFILFCTVTVVTPDSTTNAAQVKKLELQWLVLDNWEIFAELALLFEKLFPRSDTHMQGDFISTSQVRFILVSGAWALNLVLCLAHCVKLSKFLMRRVPSPQGVSQLGLLSSRNTKNQEYVTGSISPLPSHPGLLALPPHQPQAGSRMGPLHTRTVLLGVGTWGHISSAGEIICFNTLVQLCASS